MANYTSLWTSTSDKEFRQMSKFHSLQRRPLGLQMTGIRKEHARHVKRVRIEMRETGTLINQYENEKERRARHLLKTFSKVQRKRQATQGWKSAFNQRTNEATPNQAFDAESVTFDVQIGGEEAPWGGARGSRRKSSSSSFSSMATTRSRPSLSSIFGGRTSQHRGRRRSSVKRLPPIGAGSFLQSAASSSASGAPGFWKTWISAVQRCRGQANVPKEDATDVIADDKENPSAEPATAAHGDAERSEEEQGTSTEPTRQPTRQVYWTETFPFVYHSVGEAVCPRYKLFRQYDKYEVQPVRPTRRRRRSETEPSMATTAPPDEQEDTGSRRPSFKSLSKTLGALQSLATEVSALSLT